MVVVVALARVSDRVFGVLADVSLSIILALFFPVHSRAPNHILLDFYDAMGNAPFNVAATLNGVSTPTNTVTPASSSTSSSASTASVTTQSLSGARSTTSHVGGMWLGTVLVVGLSAGASMAVAGVW